MACLGLALSMGCGSTPAVGDLPDEGTGGRSYGTAMAGTSGADASVQGGKGGGATSVGDSPTVGRCSVFPADNAWNQDVSALPLLANSSAIINSIGASGHLHPDFGTEWEGAPIGIPYTVVDAIAKVPVEFTAYGDESDAGPYPIPADAAVEGGPASDGDRHVIVVDESDCRLYELYRAFPVNAGASWQADSGAVWPLTLNVTRPRDYTSADAAGLPIFPGLARYDEVVERGEVLHALRFTVSKSRAAYVAPASHAASSSTDPNLAPMGLRLRMRADYDCSGYSAEVQVLCRGLKRFGMIVADNGSNWYVSGAPDPRWNDEHLNDFKTIPGSAFEVVDSGPILLPQN
ncbi:MAG TPA: hypothetical protein VIV60_01755 [Polyangiaceae bacterium]